MIRQYARHTFEQTHSHGPPTSSYPPTHVLLGNIILRITLVLNTLVVIALLSRTIDYKFIHWIHNPFHFVCSFLDFYGINVPVKFVEFGPGHRFLCILAQCLASALILLVPGIRISGVLSLL